MRVLVTGGTGFVGFHTVEALRRSGREVRLLVRDPAKVSRLFGAAHGIDVVAGDVTDATAVSKALDGCDAVVHAAAVVALEASRAREVLDTNLRATRLVVGGAAERGFASIVYVSSLGALFTPGGPPIRADAPLARATSAYATSKKQGERFVRELQASGAPVRVSYPPAVVGPEDPGLSEGNHTVMVFLRDLMVVTSSGFSILDVRDLAEIHARLVDPAVPAGRYLIPGHYLAWPEAIATLGALTGRRLRRVHIPGPLLRGLGRLGDQVKRVFPFDFPLTAEAMAFATQWPGAEASPELEVLDAGFRPPEETYRDAIRWMVRAGHLTPAQAGVLAAPPPD